MSLPAKDSIDTKKNINVNPRMTSFHRRGTVVTHMWDGRDAYVGRP